MVALTVSRVPRAAAWPAVAWLFAACYAAAGMAAMWLLAPRVPYADGWRHLGRYLDLPFPQDVLAADNGHVELWANLVRVAELHWFGASQWLQVAVGMVLAASTVAVAWLAVRRLAAPAARAAGMLAVVLGVFWLGNFRALVHGNESVHAYAVTLALLAGLWCIVRRPRSPGDARAEMVAGALASACGMLAAFSFGSGVACFAAFGTTMLLRRSPRGMAVLVGGLVLTMVLLRLSGGAASTPEFAPWRQLELLLRWLAAPQLLAAWVLLDPGVAAQVPASMLRAPVAAIAQASEAAFGPMSLARWPHLLVGAAGLAWCAWLVAGAWRQGAGCNGAASRTQAALLTGIGLCAFAVAVGVLVAGMRLAYFEQSPDQLLAPRYLVWSSLFWAGLLLATVARLRCARRASLLVVAVALLLLPSQAWFFKLASGISPVAERTALAAAVGVLEPGLELGETVAGELLAVLPMVRDARTSVFAWPELRALGAQATVDPGLVVGVDDVRVRAVDNRLGSRARRVEFRLAAAGCARLLLVDGDGVARGLAMRRSGGSDRWLGWMQGTAALPPTVLGCSAHSAPR